MPEIQENLLATMKCFQCLSQKEKLGVIVALLCSITSRDVTQCTANELAEASKCYTCLTDAQMLDAFLIILYLYAKNVTGVDDMSEEEYREEIACLICASPKQLKAMMVYLIYQFYQNSLT